METNEVEKLKAALRMVMKDAEDNYGELSPATRDFLKTVSSAIAAPNDVKQQAVKRLAFIVAQMGELFDEAQYLANAFEIDFTLDFINPGYEPLTYYGEKRRWNSSSMNC